MSHHYFCSQRCHRLYLIRAFFAKVLSFLEIIPFPIVSGRRAGKPRGRHPAGVSGRVLPLLGAIAFLLPLIGLVILLIQNQSLKNRVNALELASPRVALEGSATNRALNDATYLRLTKPAAAMVTGNQIVIEGEAPDGHIISLRQGEWVRAVTLPESSRFALPAVRLEPGQNDFVVQALGNDGTPAVLERLSIVYGPPTANYLAADFARGNLNRRQIALTFDGGSTANAAPQVLEILAEHDLRVTVFLTGRFIERYPEITRRIVREGHEVGNHTWSHPHLTTFGENRQHQTRAGVTREFLHEQLEKTANLFHQVTHSTMAPLWRAPYGEHNADIRLWAGELGYRHIGWTIGRNWEESMDTMDWVSDTSSTAYRTPEQVLENLLAIADRNGYGANGGIILMHLASFREHDQTYQILPDLIDGLRQRSYELVRISELMRQ